MGVKEHTSFLLLFQSGTSCCRNGSQEALHWQEARALDHGMTPRVLFLISPRRWLRIWQGYYQGMGGLLTLSCPQEHTGKDIERWHLLWYFLDPQRLNPFLARRRLCWWEMMTYYDGLQVPCQSIFIFCNFFDTPQRIFDMCNKTKHL